MYHDDVRVGQAPCKGCSERVSGCHDHCEKYQGWKHKRDEIRQKDYDYFMYEHELDEYEYNRAKHRRTNRGQGGRCI